MADKEQIMAALATVQDPELHKSLTELGMIKSVELDGGKVNVEVTLTIPGCPLKKKIGDDVREAVGKLDGVESVEVSFGAMTDEQRKGLTQKLYGKDHRAASVPQPVAGDFAKRVIAVASGKGGVGKSTVTANLAAAFSRLGYKVGVLDADVYGFSIPRILGVSGPPTAIDENIVPIRRDNMQIISIGFFVDEATPVVWRGPMLHKTVNQFISDVLWDQLDFLLIDLPPGTGDITISISQALPKSEILVITTPQPVASHTAGRVARMAEKTKTAVLGVIENMSYYEINGKREYIFGKDGGIELAKELGTKFFGQIPIMTEIRASADNGEPAALSDDDTLSSYYINIAKEIADPKK